jgi:hypothetical protein
VFLPFVGIPIHKFFDETRRWSAPFTVDLLLIAVAVTGVLVAREYRREQDYSDSRLYAAGRITRHGWRARTGETIYFEAYTADIAEWQDEFSVLTTQAANGSVNSLLRISEEPAILLSRNSP